MSEPIVVESPVQANVTKQIRTVWVNGVQISGLGFMSGRLATEAEVTWVIRTGGVWEARTVRLTSSVPRRDGAPSALSKTHLLTAGEVMALLRERTDLTAPSERINITIEGGQ